MASLTDRIRAEAEKERKKEKEQFSARVNAVESIWDRHDGGNAKTNSTTGGIREAAARERAESSASPTGRRTTFAMDASPAFKRGTAPSYETSRNATGSAVESMWDRHDGSKRSYYSPPDSFTSQGEYDAWRGSIRGVNDIEAERSAIDAEIEKLKKEQAQLNISSYMKADEKRRRSYRYQEIEQQIASLREKQNLLFEELNYSKYFSYGDISNAQDFAARSKAEGSKQGTNFLQRLTDSKAAEAYDYINNIDNFRDKQIALAQSGESINSTGFEVYDYMTDEQKATFTYIYNTQGEDEAGKYLNWLKDNPMMGSESLNAMYGKDIAAGLKNDFQRVGYGVPTGINQFISGAMPLIGKEALPTSALQYANEYARDELGTFGKFLNTSASVIGNMAPSILVSTLTGGLGAPGALAAAAGTVTMGASAGGNAYNQALAEGKSRDEARQYGLLVGAAEGGLQYILGGIGALGGALPAKVLAKISLIDNALKRIAATGAVKIGSEVFEEELQNYLEPAFRTILFDEKYDAPNAEEFIETLLVTALTTGILEGGSITAAGRSAANVEGFTENAQGFDFSNADAETVSEVIASGLEKPENSEAHQMALELQKKQENGEEISGHQIGALYQASAEADIQAETERRKAQEKANKAKGTPEEQAAANITGYGRNGSKLFVELVQNEGMSLEEATKTMQTAYEQGLTGVYGSNPENFISDINQRRAYKVGQQDAMLDLAERKKNKPVIRTDAGFDMTNAPSDLSREDAAFMQLMSKAYAVTGMWGQSTESEMFDGKLNGNGIVTLARDFGISAEKLREIGGAEHLNKIANLARERNKSITFLVSHELSVHRMLELAPEEGLAFVNAMYEAQGRNRPAGVSTLAQEKRESYGEDGKPISIPLAIEEITADTIIEMYGGEASYRAAMERIIRGENEQAKKGLSKYVEILKDTVARLKNMLKRLTGKDNLPAREEVRSAIRENERLIQLFEEAQKAALRNVAKARQKNGQSTKNEAQSETVTRQGVLTHSEGPGGVDIVTTANGNPVAQTDSNGSAVFSLKTYENFGRAELKRWLDLRVSRKQIDAADAADIVKQLDEYYDLCQKFKEKYAPFGAWSDASVVTDEKGKPVFSVVKANGEYAMNLDFSLVCKKRRTLDAVFGEMIKRGMMNNVDLAEEDIARINDVIRESGFETACALCFVDSKRYRQAKVADSFVTMYNDTVKMLLPEGGDVKAHYFDFVETGHYKIDGRGLHTLSNAELKDGIEKLKQVMRENGSKTVPYKIAKHLLENPADRKYVTRSEFMNTDGFEALRVKNPNVLKLYNSSKGSGGPKAALSDVQYLGEILKKNNFTPARAYSVGGVRIRSFSDYIPRLVFDYLQMTADLSAKQLPAHAYTKEAIFVKQFGMTGIKMNMSLVPAVVKGGIAPGLDKNGNYVWFDGQSFGSDVNVKGSGQTGYELAVQIQNAPGYSRNCGTIAVGISDKHIEKMLGDENIRMVIPYHKSSLNHIVAVMNNIGEYTDYTDVQNTRLKSTGSKITGKDFNFNEALRRTGDAKTAADEYLAWCEKNGYIPKFDEFSGHENYYKLLEDFTTYDNGEATPQGAVTMTFPKEGDAFGSMAQLIEEGLDEDAVLEGRRDKNLSSIVDKVESVLTKREDAKYSKKDSTGRELSQEQQEYFKDSKVRDEKGNLMVVYHGGMVENSFDTTRGGDGSTQYGRGAYFTDSEYYAGEYSGMKGGEVRPYYLNITKMFDDSDFNGGEIADGPEWDNLVTILTGRGFNDRQIKGIKEWGFDRLKNLLAQKAGAEAPTGFFGASQLANDVLRQAGYNGIRGSLNDGFQYVIFEPSQAKLTGNEVPTGDNDVRYSRKAQDNILVQNAKLKEVNEALKAQFKLTKFAKVDAKSLDKFSRQLLKDYKSGADLNELRSDLDTLYTYIANGENGQGPSWDVAYRMAYDIAGGILEEVTAVNDDMYREYSDLRHYLRTTGLKLSKEYEKDLIGYENLAQFRKANFGRILIKNDGIPVETAYQELIERYPGFFDESVTNPADQLNLMVEVLDSLQPVEYNPYGTNMSEATTWAAYDIMDSFFDLPQAKPTFADRAERRLTEQKIKDGKKLEQLREEKNKRIKEIITAERKKASERVAKERAEKWDKVKAIKQKQRAKEAKMSENRKAKVLRERIMRHVGELHHKLTRPTDKQHIPQELQGVVLGLLESINLESGFEYAFGTDGKYHRVKRGEVLGAETTKRTQAFNELLKLYKDMEGEIVIDPDLMGENGLLNKIASMADKPIATMTSAELADVYQTIRAIEGSILNANRMFARGRWAGIHEAANALRADNEGKREFREFNGVAGKLQGITGIEMMTPETYFHLLGKSGDGIFRMMRDAQDKHIRLTAEIADFMEKEMPDAKVRKLERKMHTVTLGGEEIQLSTAQLMELYVLMEREQAKDHIFVGGILPDTVNKGIVKVSKAKPVRGVTLEEISAAVNKLSEDEVAIAKKLRDFASGRLSEIGNEASMAVYGYEKFGERNYWPIRVNRQETKSDIQQDTAVTTVSNKGFTRGTKPHANNSLRLGSIFDTFATHASEMATYAAWLGTLEDVNRIRNYTFRDEDGNTVDTVKGIIAAVHGGKGEAYLTKLLADINNGVKGTHAETDYMGAMFGNFKAAAVGANLRVIIQQPTAILRAMDMISPAYLSMPGNPISGWKKAVKYAPIAKWKDWGYFDINTGRQMKDVIFNSDSALDRVKNLTMAGAGAADSLAWGHLWNACEHETKAKRKDLTPGTDEYYEYVAERFTEIVDHTQVVDGILQRSQFMRSADTGKKMATAFMGEPTKQYNMLMQSVYDATHAPKGKRGVAFGHLLRTGIAFSIAGIVNAMAQSVMDAVRDDDDEEKYWTKLLESFQGNAKDVFNPAAYIPFIKDMWSIIQGYDVERTDMAVFEDVVDAAKIFMKALNSEGKNSKQGAAINLISALAGLAGIPASNLKREIHSFTMQYAIQSKNYMMQYGMEKFWYTLDGNKTAFTNILYNAYVNDKDAYKLIYADMVKNGMDEEYIRESMENRMRETWGVKSVTDLPQRYLSPTQQTDYDKSLRGVKGSDIWKSANADQRKALETDIYNLTVGNGYGEELTEKIDAAAAYGMSETEYLLYRLALDVYDQPNKSGEYGGTPTNAEKAAAIEAVGGLSNGEIAYLWSTDDAFEAYAAGVDMSAYVSYIGDGNSISLDKLIGAQEYDIDTDTYIDFLEMLKEVDQPSKNGKYGSYTQEEAKAAVSAMPGLTNEQRAYLWQSVKSDWKSSSNPWK